MIENEFVYIGSGEEGLINPNTEFSHKRFIHGDVYKAVAFTTGPDSSMRFIDKYGRITTVSSESFKLQFVTKSTWRDMKLNTILEK